MKWKYETGGRVVSSPAVSDGLVYIDSDDENLYALDAGNGSLKWKFDNSKSAYSSPVVVDGIVYVGSQDYYLYAIE